MKKIISIILAISLIFLAFSGCSSKTEENNETSFDLKYTYDSIYSDFDESTFRAYEDLCKAIVNYENSARFNTAMLDDVLQLIYTSFPLSYLTTSIAVNEDESGVDVTYKFDENKHKEQIKAFNDKIVEIENECGINSVNDSVYTLNVYSYVSSNMVLVDNSTASLFETVVEGKGNKFSYANLFEYLLQQKGIMAFHILGEDVSGAGWGLSSAKLQGEIYYFDMATEYYTNEGKGINYFALNTNDLKSEGIVSTKYSSNADAFESVATEFSACHTSKEWALSDTTLTLTQYNEETSTIELK